MPGHGANPSPKRVTTWFDSTGVGEVDVRRRCSLRVRTNRAPEYTSLSAMARGVGPALDALLGQLFGLVVDAVHFSRPVWRSPSTDTGQRRLGEKLAGCDGTQARRELETAPYVGSNPTLTTLLVETHRSSSYLRTHLDEGSEPTAL